MRNGNSFWKLHGNRWIQPKMDPYKQGLYGEEVVSSPKEITDGNKETTCAISKIKRSSKDGRERLKISLPSSPSLCFRSLRNRLEIARKQLGNNPKQPVVTRP